MLKTAGITFGSKLSGALLSFGLIVLVSRLLGADARGICGLYLTIIAVTTAVGDIAGGAASPFLLNKYAAIVILKGQMAWGFFAAAAITLFYFSFFRLTISEILLLTLAGWLYTTWSVLQQLLIGLKKFAAFNISAVMLPGISLLGFMLLFTLGFKTPLAYLASLSSGCLFMIIFAGVVLGKELQQRGTGKIFRKEVFRQGLLNQLSHLASLLNSRLIYFILPATALGLWANTLTLSEAFFLIPGSFGQVAYGLMATKTDKNARLQFFRKALIANILIGLPGLLVLWCMPDSFWQFVFGRTFAGISDLLKMVVPGIGIYSLYLLTTYWQSASGQFRYNLWALLAGLAVNIIASLVLYFSGHYSLFSGIWALVSGWVVATFAGLRLIYLSDKEVFRTIFQFSPKSADLGASGR